LNGAACDFETINFTVNWRVRERACMFCADMCTHTAANIAARGCFMLRVLSTNRVREAKHTQTAQAERRRLYSCAALPHYALLMIYSWQNRERQLAWCVLMGACVRAALFASFSVAIK
jgi:hypothetical protein